MAHDGERGDGDALDVGAPISTGVGSEGQMCAGMDGSDGEEAGGEQMGALAGAASGRQICAGAGAAGGGQACAGAGDRQMGARAGAAGGGQACQHGMSDAADDADDRSGGSTGSWRPEEPLDLRLVGNDLGIGMVTMRFTVRAEVARA